MTHTVNVQNIKYGYRAYDLHDKILNTIKNHIESLQKQFSKVLWFFYNNDTNNRILRNIYHDS